MSGPTDTAAEGFRTEVNSEGDSRVRKKGHQQAQCSPVPLPTLGTQRIVQGNGTNVGTVISLQCPAKHKLVGKDLLCVMGINSTQWVGNTYCQPLSYEDYGFRVAVLASIVSAGIILLLSAAFITCCLLECIKGDTRKRPERESVTLQWEELQQDNRSHYSHKGWNNNNNNNNTQKMRPLRDVANPDLCGDMQPCRCQQQYTLWPQPSHAALPGHDYNQPLLPQNLDACPPDYPGPPLSSCQTSSLVHITGTGSLWQYRGQHSSWSEVNPPITDESIVRKMNSNRTVNPRETSIRVISV